MSHLHPSKAVSETGMEITQKTINRKVNNAYHYSHAKNVLRNRIAKLHNQKMSEPTFLDQKLF